MNASKKVGDKIKACMMWWAFPCSILEGEILRVEENDLLNGVYYEVIITRSTNPEIKIGDIGLIFNTELWENVPDDVKEKLKIKHPQEDSATNQRVCWYCGEDGSHNGTVNACRACADYLGIKELENDAAELYSGAIKSHYRIGELEKKLEEIKDAYFGVQIYSCGCCKNNAKKLIDILDKLQNYGS